LQEAAHAVYALLSMVSIQSEKTVETGGQQAQMQFLPLGHSGRILELLRVVPRTGQTGEIMSATDRSAESRYD
jgi:hypothetical protein